LPGLLGGMLLTWNSRSNANYTVNFDTDLNGFEWVVNEAVPSGGDQQSAQLRQS